jgi:four helix bundle protein
MLSKLAISEEEADETLYWLELLKARHPGSSKQIDTLHKEGNEIVAILVASIKTLRKRK